MHRSRLILSLLFALLSTGLCADTLRWRRAPDRVDADIENGALPHVLEEISTATGWEIFVQPETTLDRSISVRFKNASTGEALGKLLGDLNFALLPQTNSPARLYVFRTRQGDATQALRITPKPRRGKPIPDELVVSPKPGTSADELAKRFGAKILNRADNLNSYRLKFPDEASTQTAREALLDTGDALVDYNYTMQRPPPDVTGTSVTAASLNLKPNAGPDSSRFIIGLIDTPVQPVGAPYKDFLLPALSVVDGTQANNPTPTHGTSMLETILRGLEQSPATSTTTPVRILPVDVYGNSETTSTFDVAKGIKAAIDGGASIVNLSLGSSGDSQLLHSVIAQGFDRGVLFTAAAGNEPTSALTFPAAYPEVLAVTALDRKGNLASYANFGAFVDVAAPGTGLVAYDGKNYFVTGTSTSTAFISGFASGIASTSGGKPISAAKTLISYFGVKTKAP